MTRISRILIKTNAVLFLHSHHHYHYYDDNLSQRNYNSEDFSRKLDLVVTVFHEISRDGRESRPYRIQIRGNILREREGVASSPREILSYFPVPQDYDVIHRGNILKDLT